jgi:mandelate racemase
VTLKKDEGTMGAGGLTIRSIQARGVVAPMARPLRTAVGSIPAAPLVLIDVNTDQGVTGRSYIFAYTAVALAPLVQLVENIGEELQGRAVAPVERMRALDRRFRLLGWQGLVGMAVSGLDMAFWDALGHAAGWPVAKLLGGTPRPPWRAMPRGGLGEIVSRTSLRRCPRRSQAGSEVIGAGTAL